MMKTPVVGRVHIRQTPDGSAPFIIRQQLAGIEIPAYEVSLIAGYYYVRAQEAIQKLLEHGRHEVAAFIEEHTWGTGLYPIPIHACEFVPA
jgi:hypothetical protein